MYNINGDVLMQVKIGDNLVNVVTIRKKNKNIYFRFDDDLNLVVTASKWVSEREIAKLIVKNEKSLLKMMNKCEIKKNRDEEFWYLGNKYEIVYDNNVRDIEFNNGVITVQNEKILNKFIKEKIIEIFTFEVEELKKVVKTPNFTLKFRKMKTRWGVCNYKSMTITLNTELIKYRKELLRYVIVHEMCHFYHHNHGAEFWKLVSVYYPDYKGARKELRN